MRPLTWINRSRILILVSLSGLLLNGCATALQQPSAAAPSKNQITVLYDAFGKNPAMKKDWGYAALVEVNGRRILFDTGGDHLAEWTEPLPAANASIVIDSVAVRARFPLPIVGPYDRQKR